MDTSMAPTVDNTSQQKQPNQPVRRLYGKVIATLTVFGFVLMIDFASVSSMSDIMSIDTQVLKTMTLPQSRQDFLPVASSFFDYANGTMNNEDVPLSTIKSTHLHLVGDKFLACNAPKTGCTGWKNFYLYVNTGRLLKIEETRNNPALVHRLPEKILGELHLSSEEVYEKFNNLDRIIIGRNPYVRFLSSYQDWIKRVQKTEEEVSFPEFADRYERWDFSDFNFFPGNHLQPVSQNCNFDKIGGYIVLRLEEQALWFNELLKHYNLTVQMEEFVKGGVVVFESLLDQSSAIKDFVPSIVGTVPYPSVMVKDKHNRGSSNKIFEYYTPELAAKVTELFMPDFINFNYPLWNGNPAMFHYV